jgi:hypothetical protein
MGEVPIGSRGRAYPAVIIAFWDRLSWKLDALQVPHDRGAVEAKVSAVVPRPDAAMHDSVAAFRASMHRRELRILRETGLPGRP